MSVDGKKRFFEDWLRFAAEDLLAARELADRGMFFHQTCLLCQQSVEKYLKAYLLSKGWKLVKTHELSQLVGECCVFDESFQSLYSACELLNKYVVTGRYPGDLPFESTTSEDSCIALTAAHTVEFFVVEKSGNAKP